MSFGLWIKIRKVVIFESFFNRRDSFLFKLNIFLEIFLEIVNLFFLRNRSLLVKFVKLWIFNFLAIENFIKLITKNLYFFFLFFGQKFMIIFTCCVRDLIMLNSSVNFILNYFLMNIINSLNSVLQPIIDFFTLD